MVSNSLKSSFVQISIVFSQGMLVNREITSKLSIEKSGSLTKIYSAKWKEPFTINSLVVKAFIIGSKNVASL